MNSGIKVRHDTDKKTCLAVEPDCIGVIFHGRHFELVAREFNSIDRAQFLVSMDGSLYSHDAVSRDRTGI